MVVQVVSCQLCQEISIKILSPRLYLSWKRYDLTWPRKGPKFNLYHLRKKSVIFKMAVLTPKSGIIPKITIGKLYKLFHDVIIILFSTFRIIQNGTRKTTANI